MIIPIDDDWRITTDPLNWIVQRHTKDKHGNYSDWKNIAYLGSFRQSVEWLAKRMIREDEAVGLVNAIEAVKNIARRLSDVLLDVIVVTADTKEQSDE